MVFRNPRGEGFHLRRDVANCAESAHFVVIPAERAFISDYLPKNECTERLYKLQKTLGIPPCDLVVKVTEKWSLTG